MEIASGTALFMTVLCLSNQPQHQQMGLSGCRFQPAGLCYTAIWNYITETVASSIARLDISGFLSLRLPEEESFQKKNEKHLTSISSAEY
jgi:hypothetical protein